MLTDGNKGNMYGNLKVESFQKLTSFFGAAPPIFSPLKAPQVKRKKHISRFPCLSETKSELGGLRITPIHGNINAKKNKSELSGISPTSPTHGRRWKSDPPAVNIKKSICPTSATFDEIIDFFTDPNQNFLDEDLDALLIWLPSFAKPLDLLSALRAHFDTKADMTDSKAFLELRLRQGKVLDFLNAWLQSVSGMEDLRRCQDLQDAVRKFLEEQRQDASDSNAPRLQSIIQLIDLIITHATCELDMAQDLFVQSKAREKAASSAVQMKKPRRSRSVSVSISGMPAIFAGRKSGSRQEMQRVRSWKLRYYKHRTAESSPKRSHKLRQYNSMSSDLPLKSKSELDSANIATAARSYFKADQRIHSLLHVTGSSLQPKSVDRKYSNASTDGSSIDILDSDDGLAHGIDILRQERLAKDPLLCMIERRGSKKASRQTLAVKVAHNFTTQDIKMLGSIHPRELVNQRWTTTHKAKLSPNVLSATRLFNRRVMWVTSMILSVKPSKVQTALKFCLTLADELLQLRNFNGFTQVIYGLKSPWLQRGRWKDAYDKLRSKHADKWKGYCDIFEKNNHGYRELVRSWLASGKSKRQIPCLVIFLSDIYHYDCKTPWFLDENKVKLGRRINITKVLKLYKLVNSQLAHATNGDYTSIEAEADTDLDQKVQNSLNIVLSQSDMGRIAKK